ncbi:calcium:proton antiporter [Roseiarcus fermentans]
MNRSRTEARRSRRAWRSRTGVRFSSALRHEWFLGFSWATSVAFLVYGDALLSGLEHPLWLVVIFAWLFGAVLGSALAVVRHAEHLAVYLGEPYGTLLLTLAVTFVEVTSIAAVMLHGANNPSLARDTLFAVVMIILNGMVGLSLLLGGWRHREQQYNLQGANAYLTVILPLVVLTLILPNFTQTTPGPTLSRAQEIVLALVAIGLYLTFLTLQTGRHRGYFILANNEEDALAGPLRAPRSPGHPALQHAALLVAYLLPVVILAEQFAHPVDYLIETLRFPAALGGVIIAVLVATPEAIGAVRAALANHMQRSINIFLGSVLSTIGLTVPAIIVLSELTRHDIVLGVEHSDVVMILLTLFLCVVTFGSGRTNVIQGVVHVMLFIAYLALIAQA